MEAEGEDPQALLARGPMSNRQIGIIGILFLLNALDGFDVLAIAFAAPGIVQAWTLPASSLGIVISLGLVATGLGSLFVAPLADSYGRRPLMLSMLACMAAGMLVCATSNGIVTLAIGRVLTGIGVGALVPTISALTAEYANTRYRDLSVMGVAVGFPAGGLIGGAIASALLRHGEWWTVFAAGGVLTSALAIAPWLFVPESLGFLSAKGKSDAVVRINEILDTIALPPISRLSQFAGKSKGSAREIFRRPALLAVATLVTVVYAAHNATVYYALNWMPKIVVDKSLSQSQAATVAAWCGAGGVVGSFIVAWIATRVDVKALTTVLLVAAAFAVWAFARTPADLVLLTSIAALSGAALYGAQVALYALMARSFPVNVRATGIGFVTGLGRIGGVVAPLVSGQLLTAGFQYPQVSGVMAAGSLFGALALLTTYFTPRGRLAPVE